MLSGMIRGKLSMKLRKCLTFSFSKVTGSITSSSPVSTQRSLDRTRFRLPRQKGHDWDLVYLQSQEIQSCSLWCLEQNGRKLRGRGGVSVVQTEIRTKI
uniref:Uncharacterized protein n=1 Tax=Arundo donax TaxID=35708 RepID=A0A0A9HIF0_ARUDO